MPHWECRGGTVIGGCLATGPGVSRRSAPGIPRSVALSDSRESTPPVVSSEVSGTEFATSREALLLCEEVSEDDLEDMPTRALIGCAMPSRAWRTSAQNQLTMLRSRLNAL